MENYDFWKMVLHSPVAIAVASGVIGPVLAFVGTILVMKNSNRRKDLEREKDEQAKKEERSFAIKQSIYNEFCQCFETTWGKPISTYDEKIMPVCIKMMIYAPQDVRMQAREVGLANERYINEKDESKKAELLKEVKLQADNLHSAIMNDMDMHR